MCFRLSDRSVRVVCNELNVDEKSRSMIRQFFAAYFSPNEMSMKIDVCGLGPSINAGCLVQ